MAMAGASVMRRGRPGRAGRVMATALLLVCGARAQDEEGDRRPLEVSTLDAVPARVRDVIAPHLANLSAGYKLRVMLGNYFDFGHNSSSDRLEPYVESVVPVNAAGQPDGVELFFANASARKPVRTVTWKQGVKDGPERHYDTEVYARQVEFAWVQGRQQGLRTSFYPDGTVRSETTFVDGQGDGPARTFAPDGKLTREGAMKHGKWHGVVTDFWPASGKPQRVVTYVAGQVSGEVKEFHMNGARRRETPFRNDLKHGAETEYDEQGKLVRTRYWYEGDPVSKEDYESRK